MEKKYLSEMLSKNGFSSIICESNWCLARDVESNDYHAVRYTHTSGEYFYMEDIKLDKKLNQNIGDVFDIFLKGLRDDE